MHGEIAPSVWTTRGEISMASILNCGGNQSMHFIMKKEVHKAVMQASYSTYPQKERVGVTSKEEKD